MLIILSNVYIEIDDRLPLQYLMILLIKCFEQLTIKLYIQYVNCSYALIKVADFCFLIY